MRFFVTKKRAPDKIRESARETDDLASRGGPRKLSRGVRVSDDKSGENVTKNRSTLEVMGGALSRKLRFGRRYKFSCTTFVEKRGCDKIRESARETDDLASRGGPKKLSRGVRVSDD